MKKLFISALLVGSILFVTKSQAQIAVGARIGFGIPVPVPPHRIFYPPAPVVYAPPVPYYRERPLYEPVHRRYIPNCYRKRSYWRNGRRW